MWFHLYRLVKTKISILLIWVYKFSTSQNTDRFVNSATGLKNQHGFQTQDWKSKVET